MIITREEIEAVQYTAFKAGVQVTHELAVAILVEAKHASAKAAVTSPEAAPASAEPDPVQNGYVKVIDVEKLICAKLGIDWCAEGMSIASLVDRLSAAPTVMPPPSARVGLWRTMETAPLDKSSVIIAVPTKDRDDYIIGEAYFDPDCGEGGDWWWAGTANGDWSSSSISDCNHHMPEFWQSMPAPPAIATAEDRNQPPSTHVVGNGDSESAMKDGYAQALSLYRPTQLLKALQRINEEATVANDVIRLNRDGGGNGRVKVATAMHRIAKLASEALATTEGKDNG